MSDEIAVLEAKIAQLECRKARLKRLQSARARKADTRRKILIGGGMIALARTDPAAREYVQWIVEGLARPIDRAAFEHWTPGEPLDDEI